MITNQKIKIIAFTGLIGTGKSTAIDYMTKKGYPKVCDDFVTKHIIDQIHNLINAGQCRIVADGLNSWAEYKILKHEFPGELDVVAIVAPKHLRHHRLVNRLVHPLTQSESDQHDWAEIEDIGKGGPIAIADHYIINNGNLENFYNQIDKTLNDIGF